MNIKTVALVFGATMTLVAGGMGAVACSSSSGGNGSSGSGSGSSGSSSGGGGDGTTSSSSGGSGSSSGSTGDDGGDAGTTTADCGSIPTLHKNNPGDVYCGPTDAGGLDCLFDSGSGYCCIGGSTSGTSAGPYYPQMCAANAAGCTNGAPDAGPYGPAIPVACNQIADCPTNGFTGATACCLQAASTAAEVPGCGYVKAKGGNAIVCEGTGGGAPTTCASGEQNVCSSDMDCPSGTTCKPGKWKLVQIGFCQ